MFSLVYDRFGKRHMEKGKIGRWRQMQQMSKEMKRRGQKEHSKQGD